MEVTRELLARVPKTDLHSHLDGSVRPETVWELAQEQGVKLPAASLEELEQRVKIGEDCQNLVQYLKAFDITLSVMQTRESLSRIARELCEDYAAENVRYFEVRFSPILHTKGGLKLTDIVDAVLEGLSRGEREFNVRTGCIICGMRNINPETSMLLAELTVAYKNRGVVAFDLAGAEEDFPAKKHREAFYRILNNNINVTIHAGEAYGPASIAQALHHCGTHRIGHGTRLKEDGDLLNYVNDHRIPLECCVSSNVQTRACPSASAHPIRFYYDYGLRVTVNTDNRLMSDTTVTRELEICHRELGFTWPEIKDLIIYGFKSAFLSYREKVRMINSAIAELRTIEAETSGGRPSEPTPNAAEVIPTRSGETH
ncbi:adenosine deaminase [Candidatus Sumerlaeota bacterium]|nr:adenosine deaminase [Candidatus Sumerlaeota bacterium]